MKGVGKKVDRNHFKLFGYLRCPISAFTAEIKAHASVQTELICYPGCMSVHEAPLLSLSNLLPLFSNSTPLKSDSLS